MKYTIWTHKNGESHAVRLPEHLPATAPRTLAEWKAAADRLLNNSRLALEWVEVRKDTARGEVAVYHAEVLGENEGE